MKNKRNGYFTWVALALMAFSLPASAGAFADMVKEAGGIDAIKVTPPAPPEAGCNYYVLNKRGEAAPLLRCDISKLDELITETRAKGLSSAPMERDRQPYADLLRALRIGAVTNAQALTERERIMAAERVALRRDIEAERQAFRDEAAQVRALYQQPAPAASEAPTFPRSIVCGERDFFGKVRCDLN